MIPATKPALGDDGRIWQLKITLTQTKPPIWRRIQVPGSISRYRPHQIIEAIMPWEGYHLYEFRAGQTCYGDPDSDDDFYARNIRNFRRTKLSQISPEPKAKLACVYDFGDNWGHAIVVEKILAPEPSERYPVCLKGVRAAPPEDVGGVWGYEEFLEAIRDPTHEEHQHLLDWLGGSWDPERFDLAAVNTALRRGRVHGTNKG